MFYDFAITIPAGRTEDDPVEEILELNEGVIHRVEVEFYPGPRRYVYLKLFRHEHQLWPTNPDGSFRTDAYTISFDEYYELKGEPLQLLARGYSPDADYDHVVTVRIGIIESKIALLSLKIARGLERFLHYVGIKV